MSRNSEKIGRNRQTHQRIALKNIILIIVLLVGILALGLFFCERGLSKWIDGEKRSVSEISDLKLQRLVDWSEARLKTRGLLFQGAALSNVLSEWLLKPNVPPSASLVDRLEAYSSARDIAALFILNSNKELLFNTNDDTIVWGEDTLKSLDYCVARQEAQLSDFFVSDTGKVCQDHILPIFNDEDTDRQLYGFQILRVELTSLSPYLLRLEQERASLSLYFIARTDDGFRVIQLNREGGSVVNGEGTVYGDLRLEDIESALASDYTLVRKDRHGDIAFWSAKRIPDSEWYFFSKVTSYDFRNRVRRTYLPFLLHWGFVCVIVAALFIFINQKRETERLKQLEEQRRKADLLRLPRELMMKHANECYILTDDRFRILDANDVALSRYGYETKSMLGAPLDLLFTSRSEGTEIHPRLAGAQNGESVDALYVSKEGGISPVELNVRSIEVQGERYYAITAHDTLERKAAERLLRESEERFRSFFNNLAAGVVIHELAVDENGRPIDFSIVDINPQYERWMNVKKEDVVGKRVTQAFNIEKPPHLDAYLLEGNKGPTRPIIQYIPVANRTFEIYAIPLGKGGLATIFVDVTEREKAEKALKDFQAELSETNLKLRQSIKNAKEMATRAQAANVAKGSFLANLSHELRTPLNGVIGITGLLMETALTPEQQEYAQIIRSSGEVLLTLINQVLDYSKIEAEKLNLEIIPFNLRRLIEDTLDYLSFPAQKKNLEILVSIDSQVPDALEGDPGRLRQILSNLVDNAVKFTPFGEIWVRVECDEETDVDITLKFSIKDSGIGISKAQRELLFSPFVQLDSSTTRKYGGTGLGLAIAKHLTEMMDGKIGVDSDIGKGSTFWFTARFKKAEETVGSIRPSIPIFANVSAIVVDHNRSSRSHLKNLLERFKLRCFEAENGEEALEKMRKEYETGREIDLVLFASSMSPDDLQLVRRIKSQVEWRRTKVVLMRARKAEESLERGEAAEFDSILTKPIFESQLVDLFRGVLGEETEELTTLEKEFSSDVKLERATIRNRYKVLIVEDNITNQVVAMRMCEKLGFRVEAVANGREALEVLNTVSFNLVLMDCLMPVMDGFEATRKIRGGYTGEANTRIPIIAMTAYALKGDREKCLDAGMDAYISKPVQLWELAKVMDEVLGLEDLPIARESLKQEVGNVPPPVIDSADFAERLGGDPEAAQELISVYMTDIPKQLAALREALEQKAYDPAIRLSHRIHGASLNVSANPMSAAAKDLENALRENRLDETAGLLDRMEKALEQLRFHFDAGNQEEST